MVKVGFWINVPSKIGRFYQHWEKLSLNAAIKRPFRHKFLSFLLHAYFCDKNHELVQKASFMNGKKQ